MFSGVIFYKLLEKYLIKEKYILFGDISNSVCFSLK